MSGLWQERSVACGLFLIAGGRFFFGLSDTSGFGQCLVFGRGCADVVEEFLDFEFRGGFLFGGQFLDRLAGRLKLGLFGRTGDAYAARPGTDRLSPP